MIYEGRNVRYIALSPRVLAVAREGAREDDWAAYIDAVPGKDHRVEWVAVMDCGNKLPKEVAEILFPDFAEKLEYRR